MRKIQVNKGNFVLKENVEQVYERKVTSFGNSAKVDAQKKHIGKRAYVIIMKDQSVKIFLKQGIQLVGIILGHDPIPNYMWHTDWHAIKAERLKGENILVYIDDCSRRIMSYILGSQTTQNSLFALYNAIVKHGVTPYCLNSDRGAQFIANKFDKDRKANHAFQKALEELGIVFIPSRRRHPQTNGKNERFFGILDSEFDERFKDIGEFIKWYNNERLSEAVDYMTPNEAYKKRL